MARKAKTRAQTYYEEVEALKADGMTNVEATQAVAERYGKGANAVRSSIHQYRVRYLDGLSPSPTRRGRGTARSVEDHVEGARAWLQGALELVDREVATAKAKLDAAQAHYDELTKTAAGRKTAIEQKLAALS